MIQIYIDEDDIVRFDATPDGAMARAAHINKGFLAMADNLERLVMLTTSVRRERGLSVASQVEALLQLERERVGIRS